MVLTTFCFQLSSFVARHQVARQLYAHCRKLLPRLTGPRIPEPPTAVPTSCDGMVSFFWSSKAARCCAPLRISIGSWRLNRNGALCRFGLRLPSVMLYTSFRRRSASALPAAYRTTAVLGSLINYLRHVLERYLLERQAELRAWQRVLATGDNGLRNAPLTPRSLSSVGG